MNKEQLIATLLGDIFKPTKPYEEYVTIAELRDETVGGFTKSIDTNTALISKNLINRIRSAQTNPCVVSIGISMQRDYVYKPAFWIFLSQSAGLKKAEPLVVSWGDGNHTTLFPDQGLLNAFKLVPKLLKDEIHWDDLRKPAYQVIQHKPSSAYHNVRTSPAFVRIKKEYLETYASLRKKVPVQVFNIINEVPLNQDLLTLLQGKTLYEEEFKQYTIRIAKCFHKPDVCRVEINGYKLLLENEREDLKIQEQTTGQIWPGVEGPVNDWRARHELPGEYIYVSDRVLAKYEGSDDHQVYPNSGSVRFQSRWSVTHCERVGRNAIKIDLKKLYEGNNQEVINYWNQFALDPATINFAEENIPQKAKRLVQRYFLFGRLLAGVVNRVTGFSLSPIDLITLDEKHIEYTGWSEFPTYEQVCQHVNAKQFSRDQFIARCKLLNNLLTEQINDKNLRKVVDFMGFPKKDTGSLRTLKLLDLILKYIQAAHQSGLDPIQQQVAIHEEMKALQESKPLMSLFAVNDLRQLDAHHSNDWKSKLSAGLEMLQIQPNSISNNYADATESVFDRLVDLFTAVNTLLADLEF